MLPSRQVWSLIRVKLPLRGTLVNEWRQSRQTGGFAEVATLPLGEPMRSAKAIFLCAMHARSESSALWIVQRVNGYVNRCTCDCIHSVLCGVQYEWMPLAAAGCC